MHDHSPVNLTPRFQSNAFFLHKSPIRAASCNYLVSLLRLTPPPQCRIVLLRLTLADPVHFLQHIQNGARTPRLSTARVVTVCAIYRVSVKPPSNPSSSASQCHEFVAQTHCHWSTRASPSKGHCQCAWPESGGSGRCSGTSCSDPTSQCPARIRDTLAIMP